MRGERTAHWRKEGWGYIHSGEKSPTAKSLALPLLQLRLEGLERLVALAIVN